MARLPWRRRGHSPGDPDPVFSYLSSDQGARLRSLVQQAFAERGIEVSLLPDRVEAAGGAQYGLTNIAAVCRTTGEKKWPALVSWHVDRILKALDAPSIGELDDEVVLSRVFLRLMGSSMVQDLSPYGYHRSLGGDLIEVLALDSEDSVALLTDQDVERLGVERLREAGLMNLLGEPFGTWEEIEVLPGASFTRLLGESVFTASRVLTLTDVLTRIQGDVPTPDGLLVCAPTRHQLAFHVLADAAVLAVMSDMAKYALTAFDSGVGPVSPHLFWSTNGRLRPLSRIDEDGSLRIEVDGEFAAVIERLATEDD